MAKGFHRLLGYRAVVELQKENALQDSWLWIPEDKRHKFKAAKVLQTGRYRITPKRPPLEFKAGDVVLIDTSYGSQEIHEGKRSLLIVSAHDVAAIIS